MKDIVVSILCNTAYLTYTFMPKDLHPWPTLAFFQCARLFWTYYAAVVYNTLCYNRSFNHTKSNNDISVVAIDDREEQPFSTENSVLSKVAAKLCVLKQSVSNIPSNIFFIITPLDWFLIDV